jgi:CheY-like chemotaxis protein
MPGMDGFDVAGQIKTSLEFSQTTVMMLTSSGLRGESARCRSLGISAYLVKPVSQSDLFDTITSALGKALIERSQIEDVSKPVPQSTGVLRILLAEDNAVNQHVAVRLLAKHGHRTTVAGNGYEAITAFQREPFDLILMDIQMPEMGGFEATAAIRKIETSTSTHIPIIALTAHAMKGDEERCLEAGMDGYVSKPIQIDKLLDAIRTVMQAQALKS